jgi:hypothetical protein
MTEKPWQTLLQSALETEAYEISCIECFDLLDQYAEFIIEGGNPAEIMPTVRQHLDHCNCCTHEFEALMVILQEAARNQPPSAA